MCVDYCGLNQFTIKNQHILLMILGLLDQLSHVKFFTKIDLCGAYKLVCIQEGDEWNFCFQTCYGHFEYMVIHLMPTIFQYSMIFFSMNTWMILWFVTSMTSPFFPRTWRNMNNIFNLFCTSFKKLDFTLSWKNANSIKLKWNSLDILYLEMAFAWILSRSKPLWIGLPQLFFMIFNAFLDLKTSIDTSMHIIPWEWPLSFA